MLPSNGHCYKPEKLCACGATFVAKTIRQRWCKPWCYARQDDLRRRAIEWHRRGQLEHRATAAAPVAPKSCACGSLLDGDAIQSEDHLCSVCRRRANYTSTRRARLAAQECEQPAPIYSLGVITIGQQQFDLVWNGRGSLPPAQWSRH